MTRRRIRGDRSPTANSQPDSASSHAGTVGQPATHLREGCHVVTAKLPNGDVMALEVPVDDDIGNRIAVASHPYEAVELSIVGAFLSPNPAIIDVGANVGNHAIYWALNHQAEVTAFEPYTPALQLLDANITRNGVGHLVTTHGQALGADPGRAEPEPRPGNLGATRLSTDPAGQVSVVSLDSLRPQRLDLLKIDVEGNEMAVLQGASRSIAEYRPTVWVEVLTGADRGAVRAEMADHRYPTMLMLSPTNALFLPRRSIVLRLAWHPRSMYHYVRRSLGQRVRQLRGHPAWHNNGDSAPHAETRVCDRLSERWSNLIYSSATSHDLTAT